MQDVEASLELYRWSTQDPNAQAAALAEIFRRIRPGQEPQLLREDFAGNAADSVAWIAGGRQRRAIAVDMNAPTLEHAKRRADRLLGKRAERLHFVLADVHQIAPPQVSIESTYIGANAEQVESSVTQITSAAARNAKYGFSPVPSNSQTRLSSLKRAFNASVSAFGVRRETDSIRE